jgi:hypothetical protein
MQPFPTQWCKRTLPAGIKRAHVEDIHALHLSKNFQTLKTGGLLEIGRHGTRLGTFGQKIGLGSDLYRTRGVSRVYLVASPKAMSRVDDQSASFKATAPALGMSEEAAYGRKASCAWRSRRA